MLHLKSYASAIAAVVLLFAFWLTACSPEDPGEPSEAEAEEELTFDPGTEEDRAELFDHLVETTMERDAFASLAEHPLHREHPMGMDVVAEMERYREDLIQAETDKQMWLALWKISNARKDRHLSLGTVDGGLQVPDELTNRKDLPVRFMAGYGDPDQPVFFVSDLGSRVDQQAEGTAPSTGDRLVAINGESLEDYAGAIRPYYSYSTEEGFWWRLAENIHRTRSHVPHSRFYGNKETMRLELEREDGSRYQTELPYLESGDIEWQLHEDLDHLEWGRYATRQYPGFSREPEFDTYETFNLYLPKNAARDDVVLLQWYGFRGDLLDAMDALIDYAGEQDMLDRHVIVDATRSRGGSNGAYALARLQAERFRITFGNLMVSDLMEDWVASRLESYREDPPEPERGQDPVLIREWLETDVQKAIEQDRYYTNDVPFKGGLPKWSDGIMEPADRHFTGGMTVWLSPRGGSHLDQFASQVIDNDIGHTMGMATGGFSNKWWTSETLRFPTTGRPILDYEWSMGHSIRPNGETLQYNPAQPDEFIPQTRENYFDYHPMLLERTLKRIDEGP